MVKIVESVAVRESADALWQKIGKFGSVAHWHPWLARVESEGEQEGCHREPQGRDGTRQTERLLEMSPDQHYYRYCIEETPLPVDDWTAELRVEEQGRGASTVVWSAELQPTSDDARTVATVRSFMRAGLDNIPNLQGSN